MSEEPKREALYIKYFVIKLKNHFTTSELILMLQRALEAEVYSITGKQLASIIIDCQEDSD